MCHCRVSAGCHDCRSRADYSLTIQCFGEIKLLQRHFFIDFRAWLAGPSPILGLGPIVEEAPATPIVQTPEEYSEPLPLQTAGRSGGRVVCSDRQRSRVMAAAAVTGSGRRQLPRDRQRSAAVIGPTRSCRIVPVLCRDRPGALGWEVWAAVLKAAEPS